MKDGRYHSPLRNWQRRVGKINSVDLSTAPFNKKALEYFRNEKPYQEGKSVNGKG